MFTQFMYGKEHQGLEPRAGFIPGLSLGLSIRLELVKGPGWGGGR